MHSPAAKSLAPLPLNPVSFPPAAPVLFLADSHTTRKEGITRRLKTAATKLGKRRMAAALLRQLPRTVLAWARRGYAAAPGACSDVVVIGGGPGGYVTAVRAAQLGFKTTCVEMPGTLGGSCSGLGCIPSAAMLHNGVKFNDPQETRPNMYNLKNVCGVTHTTDGKYRGNRVSFLTGIPKILSASKVGVEFHYGGRTIINGKNIIVAPKFSVKSVPGYEIDEKRILSSIGALSLGEIPTKAIIFGSGYSAIEMASVWNHLGSEVVVVDSVTQVAPDMDCEFRKMFMDVLAKKGINFMLKTKLVEIDTSSTSVRLLVEPAASACKVALEADVLVISCDEPDIDCLGLDNVGIQKDLTGKIAVDHRFMTTCPGVYVIGNCVDGPLIPHKAEEDGICCANILAGRQAAVDYGFVPSVIYAEPEVAYIGATEEKLKATGVQYGVSKFELLPSAIFEQGHPRTLKVLCEKKSDQAVGIHLMGPNAGEMVREAVGSLRYGASNIEIARACNSDSLRYGASNIEIARACNSDNTRDTIRVACFQAYLNAAHT